MSGDASIAAGSLTPLPSLRQTLLRAAAPVAPRACAPLDAVGAVLAEDVVAVGAVPPRAIALIAGWAVASAETVGASPYAPATPSRLVAVTAGEALPEGTDAVLPREAVVRDLGVDAVQQAVAPGDAVRRAGEDFAAGTLIAAAGHRLTARTALLAAAAGRHSVSIRRPRIVLGHGADAAAIRATRFFADALDDGRFELTVSGLYPATTTPADLILLIGRNEIVPGGPGLAALDAHGERLGHGVALRPGESLAWGTLAGRPVLVVPNRPEALAALVLTLIGPMVASLCGEARRMVGKRRPLTRKIVSQVGLTEIALLASSPDRGGWEPLAAGDLSWSALARADAWIELPPESEGIAEATFVTAHRL